MLQKINNESDNYIDICVCCITRQYLKLGDNKTTQTNKKAAKEESNTEWLQSGTVV